MKLNFIVKKSAILMATFLCSLMMAQSGFASSGSKKEAKLESATPSYLFVQFAAEATIEASNTVANGYQITLKHVSPYVTYFSERPERKTGSISIEKFLVLWNGQGSNSFRENAPNAALHAVQGGMAVGEQTINYAIEISNPHYDKATKTLTYTVKPLEGTALSIPEATQIHNVTLFIDGDPCLACW